jgi:hypothetical protein
MHWNIKADNGSISHTKCDCYSLEVTASRSNSLQCRPSMGKSRCCSRGRHRPDPCLIHCPASGQPFYPRFTVIATSYTPYPLFLKGRSNFLYGHSLLDDNLPWSQHSLSFTSQRSTRTGSIIVGSLDLLLSSQRAQKIDTRATVQLSSADSYGHYVLYSAV